MPRQQQQIQQTNKWIKLTVPDFNGPNQTEAANSYLRLGAIEPDVPVVGREIPATGGDGSQCGDLSKLDASQRTMADAMGEDLAAKVADFWDDYRERAGQEGMSQSERQDESGRLHTKGGWRDHTDGNRITTTRGDKLEVIRGNYRLLLLGREHTGSGGDLRDSSGGFSWGGDDAPGTVMDIRWVDRFKDECDDDGNKIGGTWMVREETWNADTYNESTGYGFEKHRGRQDSVHTGDSFSFHGPKSKLDALMSAGTAWPSAAASDMPELPGDEHRGKVVDINYADSIVEETHAGSIKSRTGSSESPIETIDDKKWVGHETTWTYGYTTDHQHGRKEEFFMGGQAAFDLAGKLEMGLAGELGISAGSKAEFRLGGVGVVPTPGGPVIVPDIDFALSNLVEVFVGMKTEVELAAKIEAGFDETCAKAMKKDVALISKDSAVAKFLGIP